MGVVESAQHTQRGTLEIRDDRLRLLVEVVVGHQRGNRDQQAGGGRDQGLRDAARKLRGLPGADFGDRVEHLDHPGNGPQQAEQG